MLIRIRNFLFYTFVSCLILIVTFVFVLSWQLVGGYAEDRYGELQNFSKVLNLVEKYYVEKVDLKKLIYGGIKGMLAELDPHTNFLPPEIFKEFENETSGEFGGLGVEISVEDGVLTVISPIEDTPAWKAGIKARDKIVEIDGVATKGLSLVEAAQKMRGKKGSKVTLGVMRKGEDKPLKIVIVRGVVKIKSVKMTDLEEGYLYIRLTSFIDSTLNDLNKYIHQHKKKHKNFRGILIDLRHNPGGLLEQAVQISDLFLEKGVIVSTIGRDEKKKDVFYAKKEGTLTGFPIIVLIDGSSASASEIVAGALGDNKRALIVGHRSFGKGSVQQVVKLGDGSGLKMTVARYYTPNGVSIQAEGIRPDIELESVDTEAFKKAIVRSRVRREKDIQGHLLSSKEKKELESKVMSKSTLFSLFSELTDKSVEDMTEKEKLLSQDFQLLQAYNYLRAWKMMKNMVQ